MKIEHLKNQFRSFTLASGKSLYLYPMAKNVEISEQDFYLSKKFQRYVKEDKAVAVLNDSASSEEASEPIVKQISLDQKSKKSKKKQKSSEE